VADDLGFQPEQSGDSLGFEVDPQHDKASGLLDAVENFGRGFYNKTIKPIADTAQAAGNAVMHPEQTASAITSSPLVQHPVDTVTQAAKQSYDTHTQMLQKARESLAKGDYEDAIQRGTNALLPVLGPSLQASIDKGKNGDMASALGEMTGDLANVAALIPGAGEAAVAKAGDALDALKTAGTVTKAAVKAGGKDVAIGAGKVATGMAAPAALAYVPGGEAVKIAAEAAGIPIAGKLVTAGGKQVAQGVKNAWAAGKDAGVAAKLQRAADSQSAAIRRVTEAFDPATAKPTATLSSPVDQTPPVAGVQPMEMPQPRPPADTQESVENAEQPPIVPRPDAMNPAIARDLPIGAKMVNPDGSRMVLQKVPLDNIDPEPGNKIYPEKVANYQANGYDVAPELRVKDDGRFQVFEGHHRITADARNGATEVTAWIPEQAKPGEVQTISFSKADQPKEFYEAKARAAKAPDEETLAGYMSQGGITAADTKQMTDAQWDQAARAAGVKTPTANGQERIRFHLNRLSTPQASPQLVKRLNQAGAMPVAEQLKQAMSQ
jgi:hypothetical protein